VAWPSANVPGSVASIRHNPNPKQRRTIISDLLSQNKRNKDTRA
jgi:hypothetical protein